MADDHRWLSGRRIRPEPIRPGVTVADLVDEAFLAYNGRRVQVGVNGEDGGANDGFAIFLPMVTNR